MESTLTMEIHLKIKLSKNKVVCDVVGARNLLLAECDRKSCNPCVQIQVIKTSSEQTKYNRASILSPRTRNIKENRNPEWNEQLQLVFNHKSCQKLSLLIQCWNSDEFEQNDLIGYHLLTIASLIDNPMDNWLSLLPNNKLLDGVKDKNCYPLLKDNPLICVSCIGSDEDRPEEGDPGTDKNSTSLTPVRNSLSPTLLRKEMDTKNAFTHEGQSSPLSLSFMPEEDSAKVHHSPSDNDVLDSITSTMNMANNFVRFKDSIHQFMKPKSGTFEDLQSMTKENKTIFDTCLQDKPSKSTNYVKYSSLPIRLDSYGHEGKNTEIEKTTRIRKRDVIKRYLPTRNAI